MPAVNREQATKSVMVLMILGITISFAGHKYQQRQQAAEITWQDVSNTMQEVESAKQDLFTSLNSKATGS